MTNYIESLKWRYATKKYDSSKKVSKEDLETLKEAVKLSVSAIGLQPYKVIIVESPEVREKLKAAAGGNNQNVIMDASQLFIFANEVNIGDKQVNDYFNNIMRTRGVEAESLKAFKDSISGFIGNLSVEDKNTWTAKQSYIALSTLINTAALLKIDATPMEGFNAAQFNEILGLDKLGLSAAVIATIGYRHEDDVMQHAAKVRKSNEELFITL